MSYEPQRRDAIRARCTRFLSRQKPPSPKQMLQALADHCGTDEQPDIYGKGPLIEGFERDVAGLLGKPAAIFMPSGTLAQVVALRAWCDHSGVNTIGLHPLSHLERNESQAYRVLHGLGACYLGDDSRQFHRADLDAVKEKLGVVVLEMPMRPLAYQLLPWDDLTSVSDACRERGVPLHLDGARMWESQPFYARPLAEIAALFDSVYVSFYKGLGGIAGAALAGPADLIETARLWQHRQGGRLVQLYPLVLAARIGLAERLPLMPRFHAEARRVADALRDLPGVAVTPDPPHATAMHITLSGTHDKVEAAVLALAEETGIWLVDRVMPTAIQNVVQLELTTDTGTFDFPSEEIRALFARIVAATR